MKDRLSLLAAVLMLSTVVLSGCSLVLAQDEGVVVVDDPTEQIKEVEVPEGVLAARAAVLDLLGVPELQWNDENITPGWPDAPVPGWMEYRFTAEGWEVTVGYAVVAPDQVVYQVAVVNSEGLRWEGEVDSSGRLIDASEVEESINIPNPAGARDVAMAYVGHAYELWSTDAPIPELGWVEEDLTAEGLVGATTLRYTAEDWAVTVSFPLVAPDATIYQVEIVSEIRGFEWEGEVNAQGEVTERSVSSANEADHGGEEVQPAPSSGKHVVAWYGYVVSTSDGAQYDDYLVLMPEGIGAEIGIEGANAAIEAEIVALRDRPEPGKYAHFWGTLTCDVIDYGGCQLLVTRLRVDGPGPFFTPDYVDGWEGTIVSGPEGPRSGGNDCLVLSSSQFMVEYGIDSTDPELAAEIAALRDTGITVRVWGQVNAGVMDWSGTQIQVERIEASREPFAADAYEGWVGHFNYQFGYGFLYPADLTVLEDQDGNVNISGPLVNNERWPCLFVSSYDSDFYRPPTGTDVREWVTQHVLYYNEISEAEIAGLPAARVTTYASPMAYGSDEYYFIKGDRLFRIVIVHCGQEDWGLYNMFLAGFNFPAAP
jgi:hypothetical protein